MLVVEKKINHPKLQAISGIIPEKNTLLIGNTRAGKSATLQTWWKQMHETMVDNPIHFTDGDGNIMHTELRNYPLSNKGIYISESELVTILESLDRDIPAQFFDKLKFKKYILLDEAFRKDNWNINVGTMGTWRLKGLVDFWEFIDSHRDIIVFATTNNNPAEIVKIGGDMLIARVGEAFPKESWVVV